MDKVQETAMRVKIGFDQLLAVTIDDVIERGRLDADEYLNDAAFCVTMNRPSDAIRKIDELGKYYREAAKELKRLAKTAEMVHTLADD